MVELTASLARRALSSEVIQPGKTRVGDVRRWLFDRAWDLGVSLWFQPDLRVQRKGKAPEMSRGFLAIAEEDLVIQRGDVVHLDFGFSFVGLSTDFQRMAYVLREGEQAAPAGLEAALANTRALQDALMREEARPGRLSADVYDGTMARMKALGITAQIYSHPLGFQGHALGPSIDMRAAARKEPPRPLRPGSYLSVELEHADAGARVGRPVRVHDGGGPGPPRGRRVPLLRRAAGAALPGALKGGPRGQRVPSSQR